MLKERTKLILETSVKDFIRNGKPITSERLYQEYNFGIKPAMIRWELHDLSKNGFFYQERPSGGRIPSDKAYKFFVKEVLEAMEPKNIFDEVDEVNDSDMENLIKFPGERRKLVKKFAKKLGVLGIFYEILKDEIYNSGFDDLFETLDFKNRDEIMSVVEDFDMIPERLNEKRSWLESESKWPQVFIGRSPITNSNHLSVIIEKIVINDEMFLMAAIGPKRMDYERSLKVFKCFIEDNI